MKIILASQSPPRRRLLSQTGLSFEVFAPHADERGIMRDMMKGEAFDPPAVCLRLAEAKALKARAAFPDAAVIASDQMAFLEGKFYGKAYTEKQAVQNLMELRGKAHELINGLWMLWRGEAFFRAVVSRMSMRPLSRRQIEAYVSLEKPLLSAGSYHAEESGIGLFEKIETEDFSAVLGLPLITVLNQLIKWGCAYPPQAKLPEPSSPGRPA